MRKITYFCDRCGTVISGQSYQLGYRLIDIESGEEVDREFNGDYCHECFDLIEQATVNVILKKDEPKKKASRPAPNKVDIDMPKVFALRKAGWSLDKIGEEFGVSGQTIANHIAAYNSEQQKEVE